MRIRDITFQQSILPAIITGIFSLLVCLLTMWLSISENKLVSRETTETKNIDGSVTKRQMEIYK